MGLEQYNPSALNHIFHPSSDLDFPVPSIPSPKIGPLNRGEGLNSGTPAVERIDFLSVSDQNLSTEKTAEEIVINKRNNPSVTQTNINQYPNNKIRRPAITFVDSVEHDHLEHLDRMAVMKIDLEPSQVGPQPSPNPSRNHADFVDHYFEYKPPLPIIIDEHSPSKVRVGPKNAPENDKIHTTKPTVSVADDRMDSMMDIIQFTTLPGQPNSEPGKYDSFLEQAQISGQALGQYSQQLYHPEAPKPSKSIFKRNVLAETEEPSEEDARFQTIDSLLTELDTDVIEKMVKQLSSENYAEFDDEMQKAINRRSGKNVVLEASMDYQDDGKEDAMSESASEQREMISVAEDRMDIGRGIDPALLQVNNFC